VFVRSLFSIAAIITLIVHVIPYSSALKSGIGHKRVKSTDFTVSTYTYPSAMPDGDVL
jgi:hypothetical protein